MKVKIKNLEKFIKVSSNAIINAIPKGYKLGKIYGDHISYHIEVGEWGEIRFVYNKIEEEDD